MTSSFFDTNFKSRIENVFLNSKTNISIDVKREDEIHPFVSGNKFRKLKYNIKQAIDLNKQAILTYGGAYSNHICATAAAAHLCGLKSIGIIRGEELAKHQEENKLNPTLDFAKHENMQFQFIDRESYRKKDNPEEQQKLLERYGDVYIIPEGGTNELAVKGCEEILHSTDVTYGIITCCVGTGGTIAGLINSSWDHQKVYGFSALKGHAHEDIKHFTSKANYQIFEEDVFGGYGKTSTELIEFINSFYRCTSIKLDPIYTGKMMYRLFDMIERHQVPQNTKILAIHSGGLQGIDGFNRRQKKKGNPSIIFKDQ